jgi:hypothetical protein
MFAGNQLNQSQEATPPTARAPTTPVAPGIQEGTTEVTLDVPALRAKPEAEIRTMFPTINVTGDTAVVEN